MIQSWNAREQTPIKIELGGIGVCDCIDISQDWDGVKGLFVFVLFSDLKLIVCYHLISEVGDISDCRTSADDKTHLWLLWAQEIYCRGETLDVLVMLKWFIMFNIIHLYANNSITLLWLVYLRCKVLLDK